MSDPVVRRAMGTFVTRSERAEDLDRLVATFVDSGIIDLVHNPKNQIIFGAGEPEKHMSCAFSRHGFVTNLQRL